MLSSYAQVISFDKTHHESLNVRDLTASAFEPQSMMYKCDPSHGKYVAYEAVDLVCYASFYLGNPR